MAGRITNPSYIRTDTCFLRSYSNQIPRGSSLPCGDIRRPRICRSTHPTCLRLGFALDPGTTRPAHPLAPVRAGLGLSLRSLFTPQPTAPTPLNLRSLPTTCPQGLGRPGSPGFRAGPRVCRRNGAPKTQLSFTGSVIFRSPVRASQSSTSPGSTTVVPVPIVIVWPLGEKAMHLPQLRPSLILALVSDPETSVLPQPASTTARQRTKSFPMWISRSVRLTQPRRDRHDTVGSFSCARASQDGRATTLDLARSVARRAH